MENIKQTNICVIGVPEEETERCKNLFEGVITGNVSNLRRKIDIQVQEAQKVLNKMNPRRSTSWHVIIKMSKVKDKEKILKREKQKNYL